ncbi:sel1 repeat family protein [Pseudomonas tolaasii]|uniref:tetratricopeptide repeat protein n=1 Tax=Pseudomonas tolaasii TaxID=29442 RepID=UPI001C59E9F7|nr:tetratricopeptide repeat protein [Pseudomonas tolaasii]MBW1248371.1 sel1 repeat family protein [Pseudomonas tolaasii]
MRLYSATLIALMIVGCDKPPTLEQGMYFYTQGQRSPAVSTLKPYADEGDHRAQLILGMAYLQEDFKDYAKSAHYFKLAADQGDVDAMYFLGKAYLDGEGVPQNTLIGESYLTKVANAGSVFALLALGKRYEKSSQESGSKEQAIQALKFFEEAFLLGNNSAPVLISSIYAHGPLSDKYLYAVWNGIFQLTKTSQKTADAYQFFPAEQREKAMMDSYALYSKFSTKKPPKSFLDEIGKYRKPAT